MRRGLSAVALALAALLGAACLASGFHRKPRIAVVDGDPLVQMGSPEKFRSAIQPLNVAAREHPDPPDGDDPVLGLEIDGNAWSYPIGLLDRVEVINDSSGEKSWVVSRCALTQVAAVYDRSIDGRVLTFENYGALWRDTAVMRDHETGTYWTVATGAALSGPLVGRRLAPLPAAYTSARAWLRAFPDSRTPDLGVPTSVPLVMRLYAMSRWEGVSGVKTGDRRHPGKRLFFSVGSGREALAFTSEEIRDRGAVEATLGGEPVVVVWERRIEAVRAWTGAAEKRRELAVVPMYWFALDRHFDTVRELTAP